MSIPHGQLDFIENYNNEWSENQTHNISWGRRGGSSDRQFRMAMRSVVTEIFVATLALPLPF